MEKDVNLKCLLLLTALCCVTKASKLTWFYCHGDYCNTEQEKFCSEVFKKCRPCNEILDDCFTQAMPQNCTKTCLDHHVEEKLQEAREKPCDVLKDIEHGSHNGSQSVLPIPGTSILFSCKKGYRLIGNDLVHCLQYGQWSSPPPICKEMSCPVLSSISNGKHNGSAKLLAPGTVVVTSCNNGTQLYGENITTCSYNGQWTNNLPICEPMGCTRPPPIKNGRWLPLEQSGKQFAHGDILRTQCDEGYSSNSPTEWTCREGLWWQSNVSFIPTCLKQGELSQSNQTWLTWLIRLTWLIVCGGFLLYCMVVVYYMCIRNNKESNKRKPVLGNLYDLPTPNTVDAQSKVNIANAETVIYVDKNITAFCMTSDRNVGDQNTTNTGDASVRTQPDHGSSNIAVEETGEGPDPSDSTSVKQLEELPNNTITVQPPEEVPNDVVPLLPDLQTVNDESLNLDPLGGTSPMKSISVEGSSLMLPQAAVGTQPLKPGDGYRSQQGDYNATSPRSSIEDLADSESDEEDDTSSLMSNRQSFLTVDNDQTFLQANALEREENNF